jgi:gallate dioxygenase
VADEGGGARDLPPINGAPAFAAHVGRSLMADEFDMSFFQDRTLDHGCFSPLSVLCKHEPEWPFPVVPLQIGVLQSPSPSARRCYKLGQVLRRAIESYPDDTRVVIIATGGLSHQVHGERAGFNNPQWDARFLELFEQDPERLLGMTLAELATLGGYEGAEVVMWLVMRGALSARVTKLHQSYYLPSMTGIATLILENHAVPPTDTELARRRARAGEQMRGAEKLEGTYPFDLARSVRAYRINKFLHGLIVPAHRAAFRSDELACMRGAGLSDEECRLIGERDWRALMHYGVIFFLLEKLAAVVGVSNLHVYAAMRGQTLAEFQKTRNAPGALYSVAGSDRVAGNWSAPGPAPPAS